MNRLSQEEREIRDAFEAGELRRVKDAQELAKRLQKYAGASISLHEHVKRRLKEDG